jgi:hypothetical protein
MHTSREPYFTVRVKVADWLMDPLAAFTVMMVDVLAFCCVNTFDLKAAPLQPVHTLSPIAANTRTMENARRFFPIKQQSATAKAGTGSSGNGLELLRPDAMLAEVSMVSAGEDAPPEGVTVAGAKLHVAPEGNPEQLSETADENPFTGVISTEAVPLWPEVMFNTFGETATVKFGDTEAMLKDADATLLLERPDAAAMA